MAEKSRPVEPLRDQSTAWMQVLGAFLLLFNSGIVTSYGIFEVYYKETLLADWSASAISWIGTVQGFVVFAAGAIIVSPIFNRGHLRALLLVGALLLVAGLLLASFAQNYWQIFLTHGLLVGLGCGCIFLPGVAIVPTYFTTRRTIAMGIAASGASCGSVVYPVVFRQLIGPLGFAWTIRVISFIALAGLYVSLAVLKLKEPAAPKPPSPPPQPPHPPLSPLPPTPAATPAPEMQSVLAPPPLVSPLLRPSSPLGVGVSIVSPTLRSPVSKELGTMSPAGLTPLSEAWLRSQPSQETLAVMSSLRPQPPLRSPTSQETLTMSPSRFSPLADPWVTSQTSRDRLAALPPLRTYASYETMTSPLVPSTSAEPLLPPSSALPLLSTPSPCLIATLPSPSLLASKPTLYLAPSYDSSPFSASKEIGPSCPSTPASSAPPSPVTHASPPLPAPPPPPSPPSKPPLLDFGALTELPFFICAMGSFLLAVGIYVPIFFLGTCVNSTINDDANFSYYIITILNAASAIGRIVPGLLADRIGPMNTIIPSLALASMLTFAWIKIDSVGGIVVFALGFGFASGAALSLSLAVVSSSLSPSLNLVGSRISLALLFVGFGLLISGPIGGALIDLETASFGKMQVFSAVFSSAGMLCFLWLRLLKGRDKPGWKL